MFKAKKIVKKISENEFREGKFKELEKQLIQ